jgi:chromosome segregation ATPase
MKSNVLLVIACVVAIALGAIAFYQKQAVSRARTELESSQAKLHAAEAKSAELQQSADKAAEENKSLKAQNAELYKLRNEVTTLRKEQSSLQQQLKVASQKAGKKEAAAPAPQPEVAPPAQSASLEQMTQTVAALRAKALAGGALTEQEQQYLQQLKPQIEQLEKSPADFATFQSGMIQAVAGVNDPAKLEQIKTVIQKVYENANSRGLDITSRPADDAAWKQQRFQLDRRATTAVQNLLSETERAAFDRSFLGVMGVDLGTGVDKSLYPDGFLGDGNARK